MANSAPPSEIVEKIKTYIGGGILNTVLELQRLFPDSVLFGSMIMYIITMSTPYRVLAIFMLFVMLFHWIISTFIAKTYGKLSTSSSGPSAYIERCTTGFRTARKEIDRILRPQAYPSLSIMSMISFATYMISTMIQFAETLETMGPEWKGRIIFASIFCVLIPASVILIRIYGIGCESVSEVLVASGFGLVTGIGLFFLMKALFGLDGINILGLPYLVDKTEQGSDVYVCAPQTTA
jgi:hypothetical protein